MSRRTAGRRAFWLAGLLVTLVVAGILSSCASASPDGLEWAAGESGFADTARDSAVAGSPLADYGVAATLVLAGGLTMLLRRRTPPRARD